MAEVNISYTRSVFKTVIRAAHENLIVSERLKQISVVSSVSWKYQQLFLCAFAELRTATVSFTISVGPSDGKLGPNTRIFILYLRFLKDRSRVFKVSQKTDTINSTVAEHFECIVCWLCSYHLLAVHSRSL
jgi:hypothetical protein